MTNPDPTVPPADPPNPPDPGNEEELNKWKSLSRKHENAYKTATKQVSDLEGELEKLKNAAGDQEAAKAKAHADIALAKLNAQLARRGVSEETATGLLAVIDPARLLKDGEPSDDGIKAVAEAIAKSATKPPAVPPDGDQGKGDKGGDAAPKMNDLFRAASGRSRG